ncbi:MAG: type II toxin-antitoxin system Phd/YefM family antitoxin [Proteobacteria bacterium]|nr:type II toxin-antitoxin system Phd/YefM family antitoxin [Pseudomonadota bacterium]
MTRFTKSTPAAKPPSRRPAPPPGHWLLQDAKARFSELVRRVRSDGPQHVTVHGRDEVVVIAAEDFRRLQGERSGKALVDALQSSSHRDVDLALPPSVTSPVRGVRL